MLVIDGKKTATGKKYGPHFHGRTPLEPVILCQQLPSVNTGYSTLTDLPARASMTREDPCFIFFYCYFSGFQHETVKSEIPKDLWIFPLLQLRRSLRQGLRGDLTHELPGEQEEQKKGCAKSGWSFKKRESHLPNSFTGSVAMILP